MQTYRVFHAQQSVSMFAPPPTRFLAEDFGLVAEVRAENLSDVYRLTNHTDQNWLSNAEVHPCTTIARSTTVGDLVLESDGRAYRCEAFGWERVFAPELKPIQPIQIEAPQPPILPKPTL